MFDLKSERSKPQQYVLDTDLYKISGKSVSIRMHYI